jgi:ABC-type nitrate/sulfonate/bicarbonate transport system substrate-binding protein
MSAALAPFRLVTFSGASNLPLWAGLERGLFAAAGIDLTLAYTPNSVELVRDLYAGKYDIALCAIDNLVAYNEGQGEADLSGPTDFVALFGVDNAMLKLVAAPRFERISDLRGQTLGVDAMTTGFAFVLRDILARHDISEQDVEIVRVGGGAQRLAALVEGRIAATLLNMPLDLLAEAAGCHGLLNANDELGAYQGVVGVMRRGHAKARERELMAFIRGFQRGFDWIVAHRDAAVGLLVRRMKDMSPAIAERAYAKLTDPVSGLRRSLTVDREGVRTVLRLRSRYAAVPKALTNPDLYVDETYVRRATPGSEEHDAG